MREIEFREWCDDEMIELGVLYLPVLNTKGLLMQYTGLKDKNGTPIYEGDIVLQKNLRKDGSVYHTNSGIVEWNTEDVGSCGCCFDSFEGVGFVIKNLWSKYDDGSDCNDKFGHLVSSEEIELEVLGNIYENTNLLKK